MFLECKQCGGQVPVEEGQSRFGVPVLRVCQHGRKVSLHAERAGQPRELPEAQQ